MLERPVQLLHQTPRSTLQLLAHPLHVRTEVLQQYIVGTKVVPHAVHEAQRPQCPAKNQTVEPRQYPRDLVPVLRDKLVHGASSFPGCFAFVSSTSYERFEALLLLVAATPRCVSVVNAFLPHTAHADADNRNRYACCEHPRSRGE